MAKLSKREHLINTALDLFSRHGYHGTGIDRILAEARISKKTLYHHFRSKDELILAALKHHDGLFRNHFMRRVAELGATPQDRILAIFDVAEEWFRDHKFFGCMFINAIGEYSDRDSPFRETCKQFKHMMRDYIISLCEQTDVAEPQSLGEEIALLLEGSIVTAQVSQKPEAAQTAKRAAATLLDRA